MTLAMFIEEATANLSADNLTAFYKYRYTFGRNEDTLEKQQNMATCIFNFIKSHFALGGKLIMGLEYYTKGMISTKPHIHIHFQSKHKADWIRKAIAREYELIGRCQSCKAEVLVDEPKFWRYPLKQQDGETKKLVKFAGFEIDEVRVMRDIAYACWKQSAEISVGKAEKKEERTTYDRLVVYLDTIAFESEKQLTIEAYKYYVENEDTFNHVTITGYVHKYLLKKGYMSYTEYYEKYNK